MTTTTAPHRRPMIPSGRSHLRAALLSVLHAGMDGCAFVADCIRADDKATAADTIHDQKLTYAGRHLHAAERYIAIEDTQAARRHIAAAVICLRAAEAADAIEDEHRGAIRCLLAGSILSCLRIRNGVLDRLLIVRKRRARPASADQMPLPEGV